MWWHIVGPFTVRLCDLNVSHLLTPVSWTVSFPLVLFTHIFTVKLLNDPVSWGLAHCFYPQAEVYLPNSTCQNPPWLADPAQQPGDNSFPTAGAIAVKTSRRNALWACWGAQEPSSSAGDTCWGQLNRNILFPHSPPLEAPASEASLEQIFVETHSHILLFYSCVTDRVRISGRTQYYVHFTKEDFTSYIISYVISRYVA